MTIADTFKTAKALLATRPIFHKTDATIRCHVLCSSLAVVLREELFDGRPHGSERRWRSNNPFRHNTISASFAQFAQKGALKKSTGGSKISPYRKDQHFNA
jgi:hypothetical protein